MFLINELYIKLIKKYTLRKIKYLFLIIFFLPFFISFTILRPIILIRFGHFDIQRIGCISKGEHYLLHNRKKNSKFTLDFWLTDNCKFNQQLLKVLKRKFIIITKVSIIYKILVLISKYFNFLSAHIIKTYPHSARLDRNKSILKLTKDEIRKGEANLKIFGIPSNAKVVCLTCRDDSYLKKKFPGKNFSYHDYRDSNIDNYIPAIKTLIKKNFYVIRMGKVAKKKINIKNKKFIDYPFHKNKSDFMDLFFAHRCYFWICGNNGLDEVAATFRKPLIDLNMAPVSSLKITHKKTILCLKEHTNYKKKKLSFKNIFNYGLETADKAEKFRRKKVKLKEHTSKQIKDIVLEMLKMMKNSWKIRSKKDLRLKDKFEKIYLDHVKLIDPEFKYKINAVYSLVFLKNNPWFLSK
jgi:putative glycosyltransferase (TIGR04372 family)